MKNIHAGTKEGIIHDVLCLKVLSLCNTFCLRCFRLSIAFRREWLSIENSTEQEENSSVVIASSEHPGSGDVSS